MSEPLITVKCRECGELLNSMYHGHFLRCGCDKVAVDGCGHGYHRILGDPKTYLVMYEKDGEEDYSA